MNIRLTPGIRQQYLAAAVLALMSVHCGGDDSSGTPSGNTPDSGTKADSGTSPGIDSGLHDSGTNTPPVTVADTGVATTTPPADSGALDAAAPATVDAGNDAAAAPDTGTVAATIPTLNGCAPGDYVDPTGTPTVTFPGTGAKFAYAPKCLTISAGQSVTFSGKFSSHPLEPGTGPTAPTAGSPDSPIVETNTGETKTIAFPKAGTYPYYCKFHYSTQDMVGSIHVK